MNNAKQSTPPWGWILLAGCSFIIALASLFFALSGRGASGSGRWLTGSPAEKFDTPADHQRGLDQAMWEVGSRYREFAWAGEQQDWNYAKYQAGKIKLTLEQAIERRPAGAENTQLFFKEGLEPLLTTLESNPEADFQASFQRFQTACINCHAREQAPMVNLYAWMNRE